MRSPPPRCRGRRTPVALSSRRMGGCRWPGRRCGSRPLWGREQVRGLGCPGNGIVWRTGRLASRPYTGCVVAVLRWVAAEELPGFAAAHGTNGWPGPEFRRAGGAAAGRAAGEHALCGPESTGSEMAGYDCQHAGPRKDRGDALRALGSGRATIHAGQARYDANVIDPPTR